MDRRRFLRWSAGLGVLGASGAWVKLALLPPSPSRVLAPAEELAGALFASLQPEARARACRAFDDPQRQVWNRGVWLGGARVFGGLFDRRQRQLLTDLLHVGLSTSGRARVPHQQFLRWPGVQLLDLFVFGDPTTDGPWQVALSGPHLNLRIGGRSPEGVAFGGPQVYGDQRGNGHSGLPGNVWRFQLEGAERLYESLTIGQREAATRPVAPPQTQLGFRGSAGGFVGVPVGELAPAARERARELVDGMLITWSEPDAAFASECIEANGGVEALHFATFEEDAGEKSFGRHVFRLEGPAAVLHFRGAPHVHAFAHVGRDGDRPLSLGEVVGENPRALEGPEVARLFEAVLRGETDAEVALYPVDSVGGRLRAGTIRTGDVTNLESWGNAVGTVTLDPQELAPTFAEALREAGKKPETGVPLRVATTSYVAREEASWRLGKVLSRERGRLLRDATVDYLRENGFSGPGR